MPIQLLFSLVIELLLALSAMLLLSQPEGFKGTRAAGWAVLSLTFCWSVILGCMVTLQQFYAGI